MVFLEPKQKLVGSLIVKAENKEPTVSLGSGGIVTGRVVDANGKPIPELKIRLVFTHREVSEIYRQMYGDSPIESDRDGRFQFNSIVPNQRFCFLFQQGKKAIYENALLHQIDKHGQKLEVGDVKVLPRPTDEEE
jgi:hypothetical protein